MKLTQPVLMHFLEDEFEMLAKTPKHSPATQVTEILSDGELLSEEEKNILF